MGVFECDELYTVRVLPKLKPTYFVLLNLFRDQLDRYGEIDHTQDVIAHALELSPATTLIYNAAVRLDCRARSQCEYCLWHRRRHRHRVRPY